MVNGLVYIVPAVLAGLLAGYWLGRRSNPAPAHSVEPTRRDWLLVHTEDVSYITPAKVVDGGIEPLSDELKAGWTLPDGAISRTLRMDQYQTLYTVYSARIALMDQRDMDIVRRGLLARSAPAFKPGGDGLQVAKVAATAVPLLLSLFLVWQFQQFGPQLQQVVGLAGPLQQLSDQVDSLNGAIAAGVPCEVDNGSEPFRPAP